MKRIVLVIILFSVFISLSSFPFHCNEQPTAFSYSTQSYRDIDYLTVNDLKAEDISSACVDCKDSNITVSSLDIDCLTDLVGFVFSNESGGSIASAYVHVFNQLYDFFGYTDSFGYFVFCNIPIGNYSISVCSDNNTACLNNISIMEGVGKNYVNIGMKELSCSKDFVKYTESVNNPSYYLYYPCPIVNVYVTDTANPSQNGMYSIDMNTYIYHVVANEINEGNSFYNSLSYDDKITALCAQSIAARTFTYYQLGGFDSGMPHNGEYMCNQPGCCQTFKPYYTNEQTVTAVNSCNALVMVDAGTYFPFWAKYFSKCDGQTHTSLDNPTNLVSVICDLHDPLLNPDPNHTMAGMCQNGMCAMAAEGYTFSEILNYYYSNMVLTTYINATERSIAPGETKYTSDSSHFYFYAESSAYYTFHLNDYYNWGVYLEIFDDDDFYYEYSNATPSSTTVFLPAGLYHLYVEAESIGVGYETNVPVAIQANGSGFRNYMYCSYSKIYKFSPSQSGYYTIDTEPWIDEDVDTMLAVLSASGNLMYYNDDRSNSNSYSHLYVYLYANTTYYIDVWTLDNENESCKLLVYKGVYSS